MLHVDANLHGEIRRDGSAIPAPQSWIFLFCRGFLCPRTVTLLSAACNYSISSHIMAMDTDLTRMLVCILQLDCLRALTVIKVTSSIESGRCWCV